MVKASTVHKIIIGLTLLGSLAYLVSKARAQATSKSSMYKGINIVDMYKAGDYPFNEYPYFTTFKKYLDLAKNDLNCNFIRLFLLKDFEEHYPNWKDRWIAVENLIQKHGFAVEYCTYMFWDSSAIYIDNYKRWVDYYIGTYKTLSMPKNRIWVVNILENSWDYYEIAQQMMPYIKSVDSDRIVTTEVWATTDGMFKNEIIGLPSAKSDISINSRIYISNTDLISTASYYPDVNSIPAVELWDHIKLQSPYNNVLISEFANNITEKVNLAKLNNAYGICYWNLHLTDSLRTPINEDYTLNDKGREIQKAYQF